MPPPIEQQNSLIFIGGRWHPGRGQDTHFWLAEPLAKLAHRLAISGVSSTSVAARGQVSYAVCVLRVSVLPTRPPTVGGESSSWLQRGKVAK